MKKNEIADILSKSIEELKKETAKIRKDMNKLVIDKFSGKHKKIDLIGKKRKELARMLTIIRLKELAK